VSSKAGFVAAPLLGLWVRIPLGHGCLSLVSVVLSGRESLRRAVHSSRGVLPSVVCQGVIENP